MRETGFRVTLPTITIAFVVLAFCLIAAMPCASYAQEPDQNGDASVSATSLTTFGVEDAQAVVTKTQKKQTMKVGQRKVFHLSGSYAEATVRSSNDAVVRCSLYEYNDNYDGEYQSPDRYMLFARGFGTAKITVTYKKFVSFKQSSYYVDENDYGEDDGYLYESDYEDALAQYEEERDMGTLDTIPFKIVTFKVVVNSGYISNLDCDGLITEKKYSYSDLFDNALYGVSCEAQDIPKYEPVDYEAQNEFRRLKNPSLNSSQCKGKFLKGKGYKVTSKGKKIIFTKTGKVTLRYKLKGHVYKILCKKVHSLSTFKKKAVSKIKKNLLVPDSMEVKEVKLKYHPIFGLYYLNVKYSAINKYGTRITSSAGAYHDYDVVIDWDRWL